MPAEPLGNFLVPGFGHPVVGVSGKMRKRRASQGPARPGAPLALFAARRIHSARVMLEMNPGIAGKAPFGGVPQNPRQGGVRHRPFREYRLVACQVGPEGAVETENRTAGAPLLPQGVPVFEAVKIKIRAPRRRPMGVQQAPVDPASRTRQVRTGGSHAPQRLDHQKTAGQSLFWIAKYALRMAAHRTIHTISGWRRAVLWPLGLLARLWGRTLRFDVSAEDRRTFATRTGPVAIILWHNRLFLASEIQRRFMKQRRIYALISASKDGGWLTAFFSLVGIFAVRGSSSRLGREAATSLVEAIREGYDVGITPDGPRGPCYDFKAGALIVARRTSAPLFLLGGEFASAWRLGSWDGFYLPKPFSRVRVSCEEIPANRVADRDAGAQLIAARLLEMNPD